MKWITRPDDQVLLGGCPQRIPKRSVMMVGSYQVRVAPVVSREPVVRHLGSLSSVPWVTLRRVRIVFPYRPTAALGAAVLVGEVALLVVAGAVAAIMDRLPEEPLWAQVPTATNS